MFVCDPCRQDRRDYSPRCDASFSDQLLSLFDEAGERLVMPREELGVGVRFRHDVRNEVGLLRSRVALRGDSIIGFPHSGGYRLQRKVYALPAS